MNPVLSWDIPAEPVKNTFPLDLTIFRTCVCSGDSVTPDSTVTGGSSARLDDGLLDTGVPEAVGTVVSIELGGNIGARRSVKHLTQV